MNKKLLLPLLALASIVTIFTGNALAEKPTIKYNKYEDLEIHTPDIFGAYASIAEQIQTYIDDQKAAEESAKKARLAASSPRGDFSSMASSSSDRWDQLAACECGGNWGCNTGNGFGGGLQFMHQSRYSTWLSFGGGEFAPHPWEATREQQIVVAERVLARSGWNAWPGCSRKFGWL